MIFAIPISECSICSSFVFEGVHALGHHCHVFLGLVLAGMYTLAWSKKNGFGFRPLQGSFRVVGEPKNKFQIYRPINGPHALDGPSSGI